MKNCTAEKVLPYKQDILNAWPEECFWFSILDGVDGGYDWIMDSVYQVAMCKPPNSQMHISFFPFRKQHCLINAFNFSPFLTKHFINRTLLYAMQPDFTKILVEAINYGYYVSTYLNQSILLEREKSFFHVGYIFGYDSLRKIFFVSDNFYNGKNGILEVDFSIMQKAYVSAVHMNAKNEGNQVVCFYHINRDFTHVFQKGNLISGIENYLSSNGNTFYYPGDHNEIIAFGLNVYHKLYEEIESMDADHIDVRNIAFLCDIARLSEKRVQYLSEKNIIAVDQCVLDIVNEQNKTYKILLMLCMKYNTKNDSKTKENILSYTKKVYQIEESLGNCLLRLLKTGNAGNGNHREADVNF